ncbi:MAG: tyrosine recombinase XerC [Clostridia bacterium]|nr:tyrosine recombinase XerC [Clostridia bacterium]
MISKDINDNSTTNNSSHLNEHKFPYANESSVECSKVLDLNVDSNIDSDTSKISYKSNHSSSNSNDIDLVQTKKFDFIPEYARNYLFYLLNVRNLSDKTVYEYYLDLRTFFRFVLCHKNVTNVDNFESINASDCQLSLIEDLSLNDLYSYLNYVREDRDNGVRSRMRKVSSLKSFYNYLCKNSVIDTNPTLYLEAPKNPKRLPVNLSLDESIKLLKSVEGQYKERNYAIITLFLNCGLRLSELVGINLSSINGNVLRIVGKGNKERIVYLNQACVDAITEYLKVRPDINSKDRNALFISREGRRISRRMVQTMVEHFIIKSGLDPNIYSTHKLRHTAATLMYQNGVDVRILQEILGHENLGTTQIYTHISDKQVENALNSNPLNNISKK